MSKTNETAHDFKTGDILATKWGYERTNVDFYEVVGVTAKSIRIRAIRSKTIEDVNNMARRVVPCPGEFVTDCFIGDGATRRVNPAFNGVRITDYANAYKWHGEPMYETSYH